MLLKQEGWRREEGEEHQVVGASWPREDGDDEGGDDGEATGHEVAEPERHRHLDEA